ncbi:chalcone isomerase family protein, partial [Vibrio astriarenae]
MMPAFVDVKPGDTLCGIYLPDRGARFYANGQLTTEVDDPAFARAFFDIWLAPGTRAPALRHHLLGESQ